MTGPTGIFATRDDQNLTVRGISVASMSQIKSIDGLAKGYAKG